MSKIMEGVWEAVLEKLTSRMESINVFRFCIFYTFNTNNNGMTIDCV